MRSHSASALGRSFSSAPALGRSFSSALGRGFSSASAFGRSVSSALGGCLSSALGRCFSSASALGRSLGRVIVAVQRGIVAFFPIPSRTTAYCPRCNNRRTARDVLGRDDISPVTGLYVAAIHFCEKACTPLALCPAGNRHYGRRRTSLSGCILYRVRIVEARPDRHYRVGRHSAVPRVVVAVRSTCLADDVPALIRVVSPGVTRGGRHLPCCN